MRALVVSIWVFINLVFFGMCGYMYLLWSQYWMFMERQSGATTSTYDQQIYFYNRGFLTPETTKPTDHKPRIKHSLKDNSTFTLVRNIKPRFPSVHVSSIELDSRKYTCDSSDSNEACTRKSKEFRGKILQEMRRVLEDESNVLRTGPENAYNVHYEGVRQDFALKTREQIMCELKKRRVKTLKRGDVKGKFDVFPKRGLYESKRFNTCAIVASSGALKNSNLGKTIDSYDVVLRFNHAPTRGFEADVGSKTTIRVVNSQVVTKKAFKFLETDIYKNITVVVWDPSDYNASLGEWLIKPEFDFLPVYSAYKKINHKPRIYVVNPRSLWLLWDFLQGNSLGINLLLPVCKTVDVFEYVPSTRVTKRCHYYDPEDNVACTFGVWHPLAAEKLLAFHINTNNDVSVFQNGYIRIPGFSTYNCL